MRVGVLKEQAAGERRVGLVPSHVPLLQKQKLEVIVEAGAGSAAGYPDSEYVEAGATVGTRGDVLGSADLVFAVRGASLVEESAAPPLREGQVVFAMFDPLLSPKTVERAAKTGATVYAMELIPRITRAQSMDVLSSMANLAGYKAVLLAANEVPRIFPMMTTAAGTLTPCRVLVLGVGVAGLQAIATAKRLGAAVEAYDIRPEVAEQVKSVGGKFIDLGLTAEGDKGGYAKEQSAEFIARQQAALGEHVRSADVIITTAQVPGRKAPVLVTAAMQKGMRAGSVIVDLAAETGGNCELTRLGKHVVEGVTMIGPENLVSDLAFHASQLYGRNLVTFALHITTKEGKLAEKDDDEIVRETRVAKGFAVTHPRVQKALETS